MVPESFRTFHMEHCHNYFLTTHSRSFYISPSRIFQNYTFYLSNTHSSVTELDRVKLESTVTVSPLHLIATCRAQKYSSA